jgi:hypothetical protein
VAACSNLRENSRALRVFSEIESPSNVVNNTPDLDSTIAMIILCSIELLEEMKLESQKFTVNYPVLQRQR